MLRRVKSLIKNAVGLRNPALHLNANERRLILAIRGGKLTYLSDKRLACLAKCCRESEGRGLPGLFIEVGCALGGSAILIASLKKPDRLFHVYDVFGMIPAPNAEDPPEVHERYKTITEGKSAGIDGDKYYGYEEDLYEIVRSNLKRFGIGSGEGQSVQLIKGLVQDTLALDQPVAFAHIDVDWHDPVLTCLERIVPNLVPGGSIVLDDYHDWGGCRKAADKYLQGVAGQFALDDSAGSMKITRVIPPA